MEPWVSLELNGPRLFIMAIIMFHQLNNLLGSLLKIENLQFFTSGAL